MARTVPNVASLKDLIDEPLGHSEWHEISQQQIQAFADATGDQQWIHVDVERSRQESPFKAPVAHGYLTLSLVPKLLSQIFVVENVTNVVNAGIEKLRLPAAVPAGSRVRLAATIKSVRDLTTEGARVAIKISMEIEANAKPALTGNIVYLYFH